MRHSIVSVHRSWLRLLALAAVALAILACGFEGGAFGATPGASRISIPTSVPTGVNPIMVPVVSSGGATQSAPMPTAPAPSAVTSEAAQGPVEAILITSPQPGQGARGTLRVEGQVDTAFAAQLNILVRDARGTVILAARPTIQPQSDHRSAFSADLAVPPAGGQQAGHVQVYAVSPQGDTVIHLTSVEVELNGEASAAAPIDPQTPEALVITFPSPNAEVKGVVKVAVVKLLGSKVIIEVRDARNQTVGRVEQTVEQAAGTPGQVLAEVPIQVSTGGPGRVLVYVVNTRDGSTEHLNSVEVNLIP